MQQLGRSLRASMGGMVGLVHRHFRILFVDSRFLGVVFKSYSSSGMKMAL